MPYNAIIFYDEDPYWRVGSEKDSDTFAEAHALAIKLSESCIAAVVEMPYDELYHQGKVEQFDDAPPNVIYFQGKRYTRSE